MFHEVDELDVSLQICDDRLSFTFVKYCTCLSGLRNLDSAFSLPCKSADLMIMFCPSFIFSFDFFTEYLVNLVGNFAVKISSKKFS